MHRYGAAILFCFMILGVSAAGAQTQCAPRCDYTHYYGPLDFSYMRPDLVAYQRCDLNGYCWPFPRQGRAPVNPFNWHTVPLPRPRRH
jgi:hypothetical protein